MSKSEYYFRHTVVWVARHVPVETPGWCTFGMVLPTIFSLVFVRGNITKAYSISLIRAIFTYRQLWWTELSIQILMALVSVSFLCRLLQISEPKYFCQYKVEEQQ